MAKTDAEKLAAIRRYCEATFAMAQEEPHPGMTTDGAAYFRAVSDGYDTVTSTVLAILNDEPVRRGKAPDATP